MTPSLPVQFFRWSSFPTGSDKHNVPSLVSLLLEHRKFSVRCRVSEISKLAYRFADQGL